MDYKDLFSCKGKVAMVTGGSGLIGREIVRALEDFGALVYSADINNTESDYTGHGSIRAIHTDISSEESIADAISGILRESNKIDILANCAYPRTADWGCKVEQVSMKSWSENMDTNLGGAFACTRAAAEQMKKQGGGSIINLASIYGVTGPDFSIYEGTDMTMPAAYAAIKSAVIGMTRYFAAYYGRYNVRVNAISPGGISSDQPDSFVRKYSDRTPLGRMARPEEMAGAAVYLASDASSYVTGENMMVDGGWTSW